MYRKAAGAKGENKQNRPNKVHTFETWYHFTCFCRWAQMLKPWRQELSRRVGWIFKISVSENTICRFKKTTDSLVWFSNPQLGSVFLLWRYMIPSCTWRLTHTSSQTQSTSLEVHLLRVREITGWWSNTHTDTHRAHRYRTQDVISMLNQPVRTTRQEDARQLISTACLWIKIERNSILPHCSLEASTHTNIQTAKTVTSSETDEQLLRFFSSLSLSFTVRIKKPCFVWRPLGVHFPTLYTKI